MSEHEHTSGVRPHCCPCGSHDHSAADSKSKGDLSRRGFMGGMSVAALGGVALSGLTWSKLAAAGPELNSAPQRRPLVVKPVFIYQTYKRVHQRSWRSWGGIETQENADKEVLAIKGELEKIAEKADFPVKFLPLTATKNAAKIGEDPDVKAADVVLVYACAGDLRPFAALEKDCIFFVRHRSGPVYLHYEIISPRFLRAHTDNLAVKGIDDEDVVVDSLDEIVWRLRALCGLRNTMGTRILAIGGAGGWAQPRDVVPELATKRWGLDIRTVPYPELGELIKAARADEATVALAKRRAAAYLKSPGTKLETKKEYVDNCFVLDQVFRKLMAEADCRAITIQGCMGTIMPLAETSACLSLSTLNDDGYMAFCESDFVVIPSGLLLCNISGHPNFLNDPTYPHDNVITLAHCTGPRKMDGKNPEPVRIMTHFESDYGAAPYVAMTKGQVVTNIAPDFAAERWLGLSGEIIDHEFMPICRDQIDIRFKADSQVVAERMPGFHWMTVYGDYLREVGYALKRTPIKWDCLG